MATWKQYECTVMSDGWTDRKSNSLINFLVNSPERTFFYKSIDASESIKTGAFLWEQLDKVVAEIGEEHVLQVITDNHASYVMPVQDLWSQENVFIGLLALLIALT